MSKKSNAAKSFAAEGLEAVQNEIAQAEAELQAVAEGVEPEGELVEVGGLEPVSFFYRYSAPKPGKTPKQAWKILEPNTTIEGVYERSFTTGKYKNPTFLIRTNAGELVGLPGAGTLNKRMEKLAEGSKVRITYTGMKTIEKGEWAGNDSHQFNVLGNKFRTL